MDIPIKNEFLSKAIKTDKKFCQTFQIEDLKKKFHVSNYIKNFKIYNNSKYYHTIKIKRKIQSDNNKNNNNIFNDSKLSSTICNFNPFPKLFWSKTLINRNDVNKNAENVILRNLNYKTERKMLSYQKQSISRKIFFDLKNILNEKKKIVPKQKLRKNNSQKLLLIKINSFNSSFINHNLNKKIENCKYKIRQNPFNINSFNFFSRDDISK